MCYFVAFIAAISKREWHATDFQGWKVKWVILPIDCCDFAQIPLK